MTESWEEEIPSGGLRWCIRCENGFPCRVDRKITLFPRTYLRILGMILYFCSTPLCAHECVVKEHGSSVTACVHRSGTPFSKHIDREVPPGLLLKTQQVKRNNHKIVFSNIKEESSFLIQCFSHPSWNFQISLLDVVALSLFGEVTL